MFIAQFCTHSWENDEIYLMFITKIYQYFRLEIT